MCAWVKRKEGGGANFQKIFFCRTRKRQEVELSEFTGTHHEETLTTIMRDRNS